MFRCRPSDIAKWPAWEVRLLEHYLAKQPAAGDRIEIALAQICSMYLAAHQKQGAQQPKVSDFLPYLDPWAVKLQKGRYSETDISILKALGAVT